MTCRHPGHPTRFHRAHSLPALTSNDTTNLAATLYARSVKPELRAALRLYDDDFATAVHGPCASPTHEPLTRSRSVCSRTGRAPALPPAAPEHEGANPLCSSIGFALLPGAWIDRACRRRGPGRRVGLCRSTELASSRGMWGHDGLLGHHQSRGDLRVRQASRNQEQGAPLPWRETLQPQAGVPAEGGARPGDVLDEPAGHGRASSASPVAIIRLDEFGHRRLLEQGTTPPAGPRDPCGPPAERRMKGRHTADWPRPVSPRAAPAARGPIRQS
jgi:hypothetical protein